VRGDNPEVAEKLRIEERELNGSDGLNSSSERRRARRARRPETESPVCVRALTRIGV